MRIKIIAKLALATLLLGAAGTISACNTIGGMGEDVSAVGRGVTKGADTTQEKMWRACAPRVFRDRRRDRAPAGARSCHHRLRDQS